LIGCAFGRGVIHASAATADEDLSNQRNQRRSVQKGLLGELREIDFALGAFKADDVLTPPKQARRLQIHSDGATCSPPPRQSLPYFSEVRLLFPRCQYRFRHHHQVRCHNFRRTDCRR
jgi:hypothetical protein